jgi:hypothetical protein
MSTDIENIADLFDEFYVIANDESPKTVKQDEPVAIENTIVEEPPAVLSLLAQEEPVVTSTIQTESTPIEVPNTPSKQVIPIQYAGANKRHIVFIYNDKNNDTRENVEMITNLIRNALKFSMDDVAVVRMSKNASLTLADINEQLMAKQVIIFGANTLLPQAKVHEVLEINQTRVLVADEAHQYHSKNEYKSKLWAGIQSVFN